MKPKISVIMPAYNAALYIREAIESVLNQSFQNFEFIIINDGSTDETLNIIQSFNDSRIVLINNSKNLGIIKTRNIGLQLAKGEYIAKMDADDVSLPMIFEIQNAYLDDNSEVAVISSKLDTKLVPEVANIIIFFLFYKYLFYCFGLFISITLSII